MEHLSTKKVRTGLLIYSIFILYCMFLGFGRPHRFDSFHFSLQIDNIPLWFPKHFSLDLLKIWLFSLGNLVAFTPFGFLIPAAFPCAMRPFHRAAAVFLTAITGLELLQMLTLLGSFDLSDIAVNTAGFSLGFAAWKLGERRKTLLSRLALWCACVFAFTVLCIGAAELCNRLVFYR